MIPDTPPEVDTHVVAGYGNSGDGLVSLALAFDGTPLRLSIQPGAMRLSATDLADKILTAMREAHRDVQAQVVDQYDRTPLDPDAPALHATLELSRRIQSDLEAKAAQVHEEVTDVWRALDGVLGEIKR